MGIAQSRDFYRLKELTIREINLIKEAFIDISPDHLKELNAEWIKIFNHIFEARKMLEQHKLFDEQWNDFIDVVCNNLEEEIHATIESESTKYLALLLNEDISFINTDDYFDFLHFLTTQYFRTNKAQSNVLSIADGVIENINLEAVWSIVRHIIATNFAWNLYIRRDTMKLYLLKNTTSTELITGDQPIINTFAIGRPANQLVDNLELYYPLSPNLAILLSDRLLEHKQKTVKLRKQDVNSYNEKIAKNSHSQIYSFAQSSLERFLI